LINIIDLIQLDVSNSISRETIETIMGSAIKLTKEHLETGGEVYWTDFAKFTFKKPTKSKKKNVLESEDEEQVASIEMQSENTKATLSKKILKKK